MLRAWLALIYTLVEANLTKKVKDTTRVSPFIVIPSNELDEVIIESNSGLGVKDAGVIVAVQIG
jgi:hypothetical protein